MKLPIFLATCLTVFFCTASAMSQTPVIAPVNIIFDTDMGNDVDDALALAMLHAFQSRHEVNLLAVTVTKDNKWAAPYVDLVNTFYGRPEIPIGTVRNGKTPESNPMIQFPSERRRPDGTFVSSQDGRTLVSQKVRLLSVMAGNFSNGQPEFNLAQDVPSAAKLFHEWPTPIVVSGFEIGLAMSFPAFRIEHDFAYVQDHPVADAYRSYMKMPYDRPTWDLTAVLYAVRSDQGYFSLSPPGTITVLPDGGSRFDKSAGGNHRYLVVTDEQRVRTLEAMILLASQPPAVSVPRH